jgi:hypothetical protein
MSNTKKMHYIPQFYLKYFSCDDNDRVFVLDKSTNKIRKQAIKDVAEENLFYDLQIGKYYVSETKDAIDEACKNEYGKKYCDLSNDEKTKANKWFEDYFGSFVEKPLSSFFNGLNQIYSCRNLFSLKRQCFISQQDKFFISKMMGLLFVRTKWYRDNLIHCFVEGEKRMLKIQNQYIGNYWSGDINIDYSKDHIKIEHFKAIYQEIYSSFFGKIFFNKAWVLFFNETSIPFCCSDDYFTIMQTIKRNDAFYGVGLASPGVEIWLPISPNVMLSFHDPCIYSRLDGCVLRQEDKQLVLNNNLEIAYQCYKYCFCNDESELGRIKAKGESDPRLLKPRGFMQVS